MGRTLPSMLEIADPAEIREKLEAVRMEAKDELALKRGVVSVLKGALTAGRAKARERLEQGAHRGRACAESLCYLQDVVIRELYTFATSHVFPAPNPSEAERLAIAAVGGYGRGTLAPGSDIDLLFLLPYKQTPWGESVVEYMLYALWDLGLKVGHSTRSIADCIRLSREDFTIRTALLEARFIYGDRPLFDELQHRFDEEVVKGTANEFVEAKLAERDVRHQRAGESRYLVEPNVKEGKGGLRDLNTLFWIAKYVYRVKQTSDLVKVGVFTREEYQTFRKAENFLWAVRCELHFLTGRAEERITFDIQTEMAKRLGYQEHRGLKAVERFMKHYFLVAKDVGDLTRIFCAVLEEQEKKKKPSIGRFMQAIRRKKVIRGFAVETNRLTVTNDKFFEKDPVNIIRLFHVAEVHGLDIHPDVLKLVTRSLGLVDASLRKNEEANRLFLEILASKKTPEATLRLMNEAGVLGRFVQDFGRIVALMQFNMYHHYTADEHLLRAIGILSEVEKGKEREEYPLAHELIGKLKSRNALYMAVFLHDIAKGRDEDHSDAGAAIARKLCPRLGMSEGETETVAWLVQNHLVMSDVAQRRDIADPRTVKDFADLVQSPERLRMLYVLTVVDIKAVGPGVWNGWKGQLLRQLYFETEAMLQGGESTLNRKGRVAEAKEALAARLSDWSKAALDRYLKRHGDAYWLSTDTDMQERHARFIEKAKDEALAISAEPAPMRDVTEITLYTQDHPGLFARFAGACAVLGMNIVDAKIFTTRDGMALDMLWVQDADGTAVREERRILRLEDMIRKVLAGEVLPPDAIESRQRRERRADAFTVAPQVFIDNEASDAFTVIEVNGLDRPGLVHALARALFHLGLTIGSAHITTYGERAVDVFYVKDVIGHKVTNANKKKAVERHLLEALADPMTKARPAKRRREDAAAAAE
ncbi:[protein-PII] uridylyltransferase [Parvibaculum sp.]|jgi:[protein-PII] uridylyltransferase|uniref:[protein-PII] uridylyltransferase n=1 Tax=Parvibaculum sp. TaxID=2024848 RepID=UPI002A257B08|nr:[protein-PII] uridylyltransferase [Parvibaculum sp.]